MQTSKLTQTTPSKITLNSLLLLLLFSSVASRAGDASDNGAILVPFEAEERLAPTGPPERVWVSDGIQHTRKAPVAGIVWGDINGTITVVGNRNLNLATGHGTAHGVAVVDAEWHGLTGTFEGISEWKLENFRVVDGQFIGHGTGDFEGMLMQAYFFNDGVRVPFSGTILVPGGN